MRLYFAAGLNFVELLKKTKVKAVLSSWLEHKENYYKDFDIFLDSGAFTAYTKGIEISNKEYIEYIRKYKLKNYASLDVIGDEKKSKENLIEMTNAGLKPIPAFHYGEKIDYLDWYLQNFNYVALGGVAQMGKDKKGLIAWLDKCFSIISVYYRSKKIKIHGFAILSYDLLKRYPFYSVDGTSWLSACKYGNIVSYNKGIKKNLYSKMYADKYNYKENIIRNIKSYLKMEQDITALWESRGISWKYE